MSPKVQSLATPSTLAAALRAGGIQDVRDDGTTRAAYSSDASLYRATPAAVAFPRNADDVIAALTICKERGVPITSRGAGTSVAGNALGTGVVLDFSRHMNRVLSIDPESKTAIVQPGTVHATLQKAAVQHGLRFGPDPSTHTRCTIGGMIGNNACGSRTLAYGRTAENITSLDVVLGTGQRLHLDERECAETPETAQLKALVRSNLGMIRTELGQFGRQVSGYALEHLLPERGFDLKKMLVGSEGTLAVILEAGVRLVRDAPFKTLVVLGFDDIGAAGDAVMDVLPFYPTACEGLDSRIVDVVRTRKGAAAVPHLPAGSAWLFVEISGDDAMEVRQRARLLESSRIAKDALLVSDSAQASALWRIREDGAGLAGRSPAGKPAHSGWEDAAVPPQHLGNYLRDFDELIKQHDLSGYPYGHFGDGCIHVRLDMPFDVPEGSALFRAFMFDAARLVARYGGSLSGEHGDGRARSELLPEMYSGEAIDAFGKAKGIFDPANLLNPGIIVDPVPLDADIRVARAKPLREGLALRFGSDDGDFSQAVHRCTGVGKCRAETRHSQTVMCPSYQATKEEKDSTRGRARVLQEMIASGAPPQWRSKEVHEALDLCLSCKGCLSDCPTGIDMASYKSEVLHQTYKGRVRPRSHYSLGWLPVWAKLAAATPQLANAVTKFPGLRSIALWAAGIDARRRIPEFPSRTFRRWFMQRRPASEATGRPPVLLWIDSFTNYFNPEIGAAAVRVLENAGYSVRIPESQTCCGLTFISTGQLDKAKAVLGQTVASLTETAKAGIPIVGLEPSCTAVLRSDAVELLGGEVAGSVADATRTLAELLATTAGYEPPALNGTNIVAQPHCHHNSVMGWEADEALLKRAGAEVQRLGGCCGLAGNFGVEKGHYDVSLAVAEQQLLPAVKAAAAESFILADGYSCRTQLEDLSDRRGIHLAKLLDDATNNEINQLPLVPEMGINELG
ncbi:FAD-binding and (Fe-S)-binding domain-containing protein [Arthrobacter sp. VKM Ac-2550]|uniref:FAD-binding and (Fe-S)-binding domain-containing protein n=1 Tax=Crystallibacter permensis TaxID=1938888 RepID=UPI0022261215|nr:FAD-binding and (Fe-S)-binding domain-containing protein [Arthrobacter sp. VKM Ac-2550]MCW2134528.1 FAD/FMN-containing dehydrogenase [Arthrobacter sp. VKM Ac-2550]